MKKWLLIILFIIPFGKGFAANDTLRQERFQRATKLLLADSTDNALRVFDQLRSEGVSGACLFNNMGNACYKKKLYGKAIAFYEKALVLAPRDTQVLHNRDIAAAKLKNVSLSKRPSIFAGSIFDAATVDDFLIMVTVALLLSGVLFFIASAGVWRLDTGFIRRLAATASAVCTALLLLLGAALWYNQSSDLIIITAPKAAVNIGPAATAKTTAVLNEGEHVQVQGFYNGWYKVKADGSTGWVAAVNAEAIE